MKLLYCKSCKDIFNLTHVEKKCSCGSTSGKYLENGMDAEIEGDCSPLAIANEDFAKALQMAEIENHHQEEPTACSGVSFYAYALLECSTTLRRR